MIVLHASLVFGVQAQLGEGAFWHPDHQLLYWLDIEGRSLHRFDPKNNRDDLTPLERRVGCVVPTNSGTLFLAGEQGIEEFWPETGKRVFLMDPESDRPTNRLNDGKCSPEGRFWFGSLSMVRESHQASFYRMDFDGTVHRKLTGLTNSNGIGWSPDGKTLYHIDTPTRTVAAFDYDMEFGEITNKRIIVRFPEDPDFGRPDGMTVDTEGKLWVAHWLGGRVTCWTPGGTLFQTVLVPVRRVTSVAFGSDDLQTLFITTASHGMSDEEKKHEPDAGRLFAMRLEVPGLPVNFFRKNFQSQKT